MMAVSINQKEDLSKNLYCNQCHEESQIISDDIVKKREQSTCSTMKSKGEFDKENLQNMGDSVCRSMSDPKLNEVEDCVLERNDDVNLSSDSLSSSASISDSDITSTDSEDSLALSESESITDVTPLNSPYCDSPLPPNKHIEYQPEDKNASNSARDIDCSVSGDSHRPEMNVLMKAIEKLEIEARSNSDFGYRENSMHRRAPTISNEETKKIEQENQRLLKRVISQQNRIRSIYSTSNPPGIKAVPCRHQELVKSDSDISGTPKKSLIGKSTKEAERSHVHRRQKCLSHPSSFMYSCSHHIDKTSLTDVFCCESEKKKFAEIKKVSPPSSIKCEEVNSGSSELN